MGKLTKAQMELLIEAARPQGTSCVEQYRPAQKLVALELAEWQKRPLSTRLNATALGRSLLSSEPRSP